MKTSFCMMGFGYTQDIAEECIELCGKLGYDGIEFWKQYLDTADPDPMLSPFLKVVFETMPGNARLRDLLHERHPALFLEADALPEELKLLGAGSRFHIAVLSPSGLTPMVTIDPSGGTPATIVDEIVRVLERLDDVWR